MKYLLFLFPKVFDSWYSRGMGSKWYVDYFLSF